MGVLDELFAELHLLIRSHGINAAPHMHDRDVYRLRKRIGFEPNGRASETWEETWKLELPWCYHHWKHTRDGWTKGKNDHSMKFQASTMRRVLRRTSAFLMDAQMQGLRLGDNRREQSTEKAPE